MQISPRQSFILRKLVANQQLDSPVGSRWLADLGLARGNLGAVSVLGPVRMDYPRAIIAVRQAASELSRFVADVYDE